MSIQLEGYLGLYGDQAALAKVTQRLEFYVNDISNSKVPAKVAPMTFVFPETSNELENVDCYGYWRNSTNNQVILGLDIKSSIHSQGFLGICKKFGLQGCLMYRPMCDSDGGMAEHVKIPIKIKGFRAPSYYIDISRGGKLGNYVNTHRPLEVVSSGKEELQVTFKDEQGKTEKFGPGKYIVKVSGLANFRLDIFYGKYLAAYKLLYNTTSIELFSTIEFVRNYLREAAQSAVNVIDNIYFGNVATADQMDSLEWAKAIGIDTEFVHYIEEEDFSIKNSSVPQLKVLLKHLYDFSKSLHISQVIALGDPDIWGIPETTVRGNVLAPELLEFVVKDQKES